MSGFGGSYGGAGDMIRRLMDQANGFQGSGNTNGRPPQQAGVGPGEAQGGFPQYGQQGQYNALTQDMSRGYMGNYNFNNNMFGYTPYGNPFAQQQRPMGGFPFPGGQPPGIQPNRPPIMGDGGMDFGRRYQMRSPMMGGGYGGQMNYAQPFGGYQPMQQMSQPSFGGGFSGYKPYGGGGMMNYPQMTTRAMW